MRLHTHLKRMMVKECLAYIEYEDGSISVGIYSLADNLSFELLEMESWVKEFKGKPVKIVRCSNLKKKVLLRQINKQTPKPQ